MQKQSPFLRLWDLGKSEHSGRIRAICSAAIGVREAAAGWKLNA